MTKVRNKKFNRDWPSELRDVFRTMFNICDLSALKLYVYIVSCIKDVWHGPKSEQIFTCSKSRIETVEKGVKYVQS